MHGQGAEVRHDERERIDEQVVDSSQHGHAGKVLGNFGKREELPFRDIRKNSVEYREEHEHRRRADQVTDRALPRHALFVFEFSDQDEEQGGIEEPTHRVSGAAEETARAVHAHGRKRRKFRVRNGKQHDSEEADDGDRRDDIPRPPEVAERFRAEVRAEQVKGRERNDGGEGVVKDALHHQLLFEQRQERRKEQEQRQRGKYDLRCDLSEGVAQHVVKGAVAAREQHDQKDDSRLQ